MTTILSIQSSINGANSVSRKLSAQIIEQLQAAYPDSNVIERDLNDSPLPHFETLHMLATRTPVENRTTEQLEAAAFNNELVEELMEADVLVIGIPFYNFNIPSTLKSWLDHIAVPGKTFTYKNGRPQGLVLNKKVFLAIAVGGVYANTPLAGVDNTEPFMRSFLGFLGMTDITVFKADGLAMPELREQHLQQTLEAIEEFAY